MNAVFDCGHEGVRVFPSSPPTILWNLRSAFCSGELQLFGAAALSFTNLVKFFSFFPDVQLEGRFRTRQSSWQPQAHWGLAHDAEVRLRPWSLGGQIPTHDSAPQQETTL